MSEKRARIVEAALRLFCENGFQNTSTAAISKEAGVATGTLFLYFKSKDELINALYREAKTALAQSFQQDLPEEAPVTAKLRHFWHQAIAWAQANPYQFRFLTMFSHSPFITNLTKEEAASSFQFTKDLIEHAIEAGIFTPMDSNLFIALFNGQLNATIAYLMQHPGTDNQQKTTEQAFEIFLKGVTPPHSAAR